MNVNLCFHLWKGGAFYKETIVQLSSSNWTITGDRNLQTHHEKSVRRAMIY